VNDSYLMDLASLLIMHEISVILTNKCAQLSLDLP